MKAIIAITVEFVKRHKETVWRSVFILVIVWSGYNLGLIRARSGAVPAQSLQPFVVRDSIVSRTPNPQGQGSATKKSGVINDDPRVVVSKSSSSKKYHHVWCASANRIKEANRVWYPTAQAAEAAGYSLAGNCTE